MCFATWPCCRILYVVHQSSGQNKEGAVSLCIPLARNLLPLKSVEGLRAQASLFQGLFLDCRVVLVSVMRFVLSPLTFYRREGKHVAC